MRRAAGACRCTLVACCVATIAGVAQAQRTESRDPSGNLRGYVQREGDRSVLRDNAGNPHGYWQREGDWLVRRDNSGDLLNRQRIR